MFHCHHCGWQGGGGRTRYVAANRSASPPSRASEQQDMVDAAARIWCNSVDPRGTAAQDYLAAREVLLPDSLAGAVIRFHTALQFEGRTVPGMVALLRDIHTDMPCGIIRTFLDAQGNKLKRMMLGRAGNAAVKLDCDADVAEGLHVGEGFETCLAAYLAGYRPVWALGSAGAIEKFPVLDGIEALTILTEIDDGGANARAIAAAAERWLRADREVFAVEMLVGNDLNDAWKRGQ
jgi:putative DNA primase/helicase